MIYNILIGIIFIIIGAGIVTDKEIFVWGNILDLSKNNLYLYEGGFFIIIGIIFIFLPSKNKEEKK